MLHHCLLPNSPSNRCATRMHAGTGLFLRPPAPSARSLRPAAAASAPPNHARPHPDARRPLPSPMRRRPQVAQHLRASPPIELLRPCFQPWRGGLLSLDAVVERLAQLLPPTCEELERDFAGSTC